MAASGVRRAPRGSRRTGAVTETVQSLHRIFQATDAFSKYVLRRYGVSGPQIWALRAIAADDGLPLGELADRLYLHASTVCGIIDRLERRQLVTRERGLDDRRVVRLRITTRGRSVLQSTPEPPRYLILRGVQRLPDSDLQALKRSVRLLSRIMRIPHAGDGGEAL
jgi:DNA-binding MarR family transcriptional regulator